MVGGRDAETTFGRSREAATDQEAASDGDSAIKVGYRGLLWPLRTLGHFHRLFTRSERLFLVAPVAPLWWALIETTRYLVFLGRRERWPAARVLRKSRKNEANWTTF